MYRKKGVLLGLCISVVVTATACGSNKTNAEDVMHEEEQREETVDMQTEQDVETENDEEIADEEIVEDEDVDVSSEKEHDEETVDKLYRIGDAELKEIIDRYDKVFSDSRVKGYFGYNVPTGWKWPEYNTWEDVDGREVQRSVDFWINESNSSETVEVESFYSGLRDGANLVAYDSEGNTWEIQSDETEYMNHYNDALHVFRETGEWIEPERANCPQSTVILYCTDRIFRGEIDTPYGKGTLYSAVYENVFYTGYDEEMYCYTAVDDSDHYWSVGEGMILEIDNYFIQIEYQLSDWREYSEYPKDFINAEYTGRLEEIISQMFEIE